MWSYSSGSSQDCHICEEPVYGDGPYGLCDQCLNTVLFAEHSYSDNWERFVAKNSRDEYHRRVERYRRLYSAEARQYSELDQLRREMERLNTPLHAPSIQIREVLADLLELGPSLIEHLRRNSDDLNRIAPEVFEYLIAEFFIQRNMFTEVALVGRDSSTSADLFAGTKVANGEVDLRVFVETKRWKDRVGIEVIDRVHGAMFGERSRHGWDTAMLVTTSSLADIKKYSRADIRKLGITVKDKSDLLRWLTDYVPNKNGLWLPKPPRQMPLLRNNEGDHQTPSTRPMNC